MFNSRLSLECAAIRTILGNVPIDNEISGVLENYLKPISKLSELFPNQQVEVQLEIDGSNYGGTAPKRYNLRRSKPTQ
ncbi:unnamed protein product [Leptosia nina]|uniref:Uncharacterized protein n=1 Tax=Leptosia nina TaxID=320188 RepID=A0AAV1K2B9_9NEOP